MRTLLTYGIICGLAYSLYLYLDFLMGYQSENFDIGIWTSIAIFLIPLIFSYFGSRIRLTNLRSSSLLQGITGSMAIVGIGFLIAGVYTWWHADHITPDYVDNFKQFIEAKGNELGLSPEDLQPSYQRIESGYSPAGRLQKTLVGFVITGILGGIIAALVRRRHQAL